MTPAPQSDRLLFHFALDKWQCRLLPVACPSLSFVLSFFPLSLQQCAITDPEQKEKNRTAEILSVQSVDFTATFQMCHFLRFFVSLVVEVDVGSESMVDNDQPCLRTWDLSLGFFSLIITCEMHLLFWENLPWV